MTPALGFGWEKATNPLPLDLARIMSEQLGATKLRLMLQRSTIQKEKGGPIDFSFVDPTIDNARTAGMTVSVGFTFLNEWMTGGRALLTGYDDECAKGARSLTPEEAPQCYDPAIINVIDSAAIYEQAAVFAEHVGGRVDTFDVENEPGVRDYFLTAKDEDAQSAIERWFNKIAIPFVSGVRSVLPHAKFRSQFDQWCNYAYCLELESMLGGVDSHIFDEIGVHPYADSLGQVVAKYIDEFEFRLKPYLAPRYIQQPSGIVDGHVIDGLVTYGPERKLIVAEIQKVDNFRLMQMLQCDVFEHDPSRYITMHMEYPSLLVPGLPGGPRTFELTEEGNAFAKQVRVEDNADSQL